MVVSGSVYFLTIFTFFSFFFRIMGLYPITNSLLLSCNTLTPTLPGTIFFKIISNEVLRVCILFFMIFTIVIPEFWDFIPLESWAVMAMIVR